MTQRRQTKPRADGEPKAIDTDDYRRALSRFATGVTVVTALDADGGKTGITVSSFNSVSLEPPLILWSVGFESMSFDVFTTTEHFAVHVLAKHQRELSDRFAARDTDKFSRLACSEGLGGVPILPDYAACFECSTEQVYPGGDHKIIIGRVHRFDYRDTDSLIICRSQFLP